jgi:anti-sigma regulatory factor (Ser/Thr protein kinase)
MSASLSVQLKHSFGDIPPAMDIATGWLTQCGVKPEVKYLALLAIEELATNCMKFGFSPHANHTIVVDMSIADGRLVIVVTDDGRAFNPLENRDPNTTIPVENRDIGGLGIHLLKKMADKFCYVRQNHHNITTIEKMLLDPES